MAHLEVNNLRVEFPTRRGILTAVDDISFHIDEGEVLGVVGESGAGKSMTGNAVIGLLDPPGRIAGGEIILGGRRIDNLSYEEMRRVRGKEIGAIFQDPLTSLNPLYSVGQQLTETILTHLDITPTKARERALNWLQEVGIPAPEMRIGHYPHQFSGGMRQRVVIALALCAEPRLVIADEPTTALDVSIQAQIITLLKRLCREHGTAVMLVTHDMGVIAETADRVAVMYAGRIAEVGPVRDVINNAQHPYTHGLMGSIPAIGHDAERLTQIDGAMPRLTDIPNGCRFSPRCPKAFDRCFTDQPEPIDRNGRETACWLFDEEVATGMKPPAGSMTGRPQKSETAVVPSSQKTPKMSHHAMIRVDSLKRGFDVSASWLNRVLEGQERQYLKAVDGIDFEIPQGETFGLVGESGCGKSTVARLVVGLYRPSEGRIWFEGRNIGGLNRKEMAPIRRRIQMIFQDPYASLNPRWRVKDIIAEPIRAFGLVEGKAETRARVGELLEQVKLTAADGDKYPHEFSGGQRQRISIARALASEPDFLVCDEPTSALDVSVQAQILNLMKDLQRDLGLTYLFISHNLAVVQHISERVGVMYLGHLVEVAPTKTLFTNPRHPYTRMLLDAVPDMDMTGRARLPVQGEVPNPIAPPSGCTFHPRCTFANDRCRAEPPLPRAVDGGAMIACHGLEEGRIEQGPVLTPPTLAATEVSSVDGI